MRGWGESVDRVLVMRRIAALEAEKAELIRILLEVEERCAVVVNRQAHEVLKDIPSWRNPGEQVQKKKRMPGMMTWQDRRKVLEHRLSAKTRKLKTRTAEIAAALGQGPEFVPVPEKSLEQPETVAVEGTQPRAAVPHENGQGGSDVGA